MEAYCDGCKFSFVEPVAQNEALISAVELGHTKCLELLIREGADVNAVGPFCNSSLQEAINNDHFECFELLLRAGADVNGSKIGKPVLIEAARKGLEQYVNLLISAGAGVNVRNKFGNTALIAAVKSGNENCVKRLIHAGADVNGSASGITPLHIVLDESDVLNVKLLIESGAEVNKADYFGMTSLMYAVRNEGADEHGFVDLLLETGADVNARDARGDTALFMSASAGNKNCVKHLLRAGAHINKFHISFDSANDRNCSHYHHQQGKPLSAELLKLMVVAGINGTDFNMLNRIADLMNETKITMSDLRKKSREELSLMNKCRTAIRHYLKQSDPPVNLFIKVPHLGLPSLMVDYLLYDMSLD